MGGTLSSVKTIVQSTAINGGVAGILAAVIAIWIIVYWIIDECSFDNNKHCKRPDNETERANHRNIMFIMAVVALIPALIAMGFLVLSVGVGLSDSIKKVKHSAYKKIGRRRRR